MRQLTLTALARSDLGDIRRYTLGRYGRRAASAYHELLMQALRDIRDDPFRPGSKVRQEIGAGLRSYHATYSRRRAGSRVGSPRHFILYFLPREDLIVVSRILHDSRDLARHVPDERFE